MVGSSAAESAISGAVHQKRHSASTLVVFDFDWSLIDENSDTYVIQKLQPSLLNLVEEMRSHRAVWTHIMDTALQRMFETGISVKDISRSLQSTPIQEGMLEALDLAKSQECALAIISDANTFYIDEILKHHGKREYFTSIVTNPASILGDGRLTVRTYQDEADPHKCALCPPQMCKGQILKSLLRDHGKVYNKVVYIGDGSGDYCACTTMSRGDIILARQGNDNHKFALLQKIRVNEGSINATVKEWSTGHDVLSIFKEILVED